MLNGETPARPAPIPPTQAPSFDTLPDIARKFRAAANRLGAAECHLFAVASAGVRRRLVPCLDFDHAVGSPVAAALAERLSGAAADMAAAAGTVLWWPGAAGTRPRLDGFPWCERIAAPVAAPGIALPLVTERSRHGLAAFIGEAVGTDAATLTETHARCHALFAVVANLRPVEDGVPQRMSRRELECLKLTANGRTSEDIARELGLSVHTANQYLINATQKLNAVNRVHAVAKALRAGLIG